MIPRRWFLRRKAVPAIEPFPEVDQLATPAAEWPPRVRVVKADALPAAGTLSYARGDLVHQEKARLQHCS